MSLPKLRAPTNTCTRGDCTCTREGNARVHERGTHVCTRGDCTCAREGNARVHEKGLHVCTRGLHVYTRGDCTCARRLQSLHTLTSQCGIKYESFSPKAVHTIWKKCTQLESASFMRRWRLTLSESFCLFNVSMIALASSRPCIKDNTFWFWEWR